MQLELTPHEKQLALARCIRLLVVPWSRLVLVPRTTLQALVRCTPPQELAQRKHSTTRLKHATSKRTSLLVHRQEVSTHKFHCLIQRQEVSTHMSTVSSPSWLGRQVQRREVSTHLPHRLFHSWHDRLNFNGTSPWLQRREVSTHISHQTFHK